MESLDVLLNARPTSEIWQQVCTHLARLSTAELDAVAPRVLAWPAQQRPMPDEWWAQWTAGDRRPHHALAGVRRLGTLADAEAGHADGAPDEDGASGAHADGGGGGGGNGEDGGEGEGGEEAYFYNGATATAAPSHLSFLALGAAAEWHHNGGDIIGWNTLHADRLTWFLEGADYHDEPYDMQLSPDGRTLVTSVERRWYAWDTESGDELWTLPDRPGSTGGRDEADEDEEDEEDDEDFDDENDEDDDEDDDGMGMDDLVRVGFAGDGRRVAFGTADSGRVAVVETLTGRVVLDVPAGQAYGPVALNADGRLLAHVSAGGRVVLREVDGGAVLASAPTGLGKVNAVAFALDGTGLIAAGCAAAGDEPADAAAEAPRRSGTESVPAARLLSLGPAGDGASLTAGALLRPAGFAEELNADCLMAAVGTRAVWTDLGPFAYVVTDDGTVLFDAGARTLWAHPSARVASFTPDGTAMVTVDDDAIEAWFLPGLTPGPVAA